MNFIRFCIADTDYYNGSCSTNYLDSQHLQYEYRATWSSTLWKPFTLGYFGLPYGD